MALIDYAFRENAQVLQLICKMAAGWHRAAKTYCYSEECKKIELTGGVTLRAQVSVFPLPVTISPSAAAFALSSVHEGGDRSTIFWEANPESLIVSVRLRELDGQPNGLLPVVRTADERKPCVRWEDAVFDMLGGYRIALLLVFNPAANAPGPTE